MFSTFLGYFLTNCTVHLEKRETNKTWRKYKKSSGDGAPKLQISVPCRGRTCPDYVPFLFPDREHQEGLCVACNGFGWPCGFLKRTRSVPEVFLVMEL